MSRSYKYDARGKLKVAYLSGEIAGFAIFVNRYENFYEKLSPLES